ncbi:Ubiquitin carboxyl-terminal hydrolase 21 [Cricetulus griseus]|uniref:Ubiquitin carboxyl-terminal hydrolase 21 n=1 Tax=Cricetulus griseus TaxID=10029 RepID=G3HZJ2_CRIGR|nr:Ubiquitin carboxyl-terminal hydrolase 21 [Cricetulus griseus]
MPEHMVPGNTGVQSIGSVHYGHYTALCWCQIGWHVYNDSHVFPVSENQVASNDGYSCSTN